MQELRDWYLGTLVTAIERLQALREALGEGGSDAAEEIRKAVHPLRGSGGTYGFPKISQRAAAAEEAADEEIGDRLDELLSTLRATVAEGTGGTQPAAAGRGFEAAVVAASTLSQGASEPVAGRGLAGAPATALGASEPDRVLIVEDDPAYSRLLEDGLSGAGREVIVAATALEAREVVANQKISLIILDLVLPDADGRTLLMSFRSRPATASVPIIVLTVRGGAETEAECLSLGADLFFAKPLEREPFWLAVAQALQRDPEQEVFVLKDRLTGIPNRAAFRQAFEQSAAEAQQQDLPRSLAVIDLDRFRSVNDSCGVATGDKVLRHVASTLAGVARGSDSVARLQGDRFAALFNGSDAATGATFLTAAQATLTRSPYHREEGGIIEVAFSAGVIDLEPETEFHDALAKASSLLYVAKAAGRGRVLTAADETTVPRKTVLLAEDDDATAKIITERLQRESFEVLRFADGAAALEGAQGAAISLFLLDVRMPVMDGFQLLERLRAMPAFAKTPIVMLTSLGSDEYVARGFELGANDYIVKPTAPQDVVTRIQRLLGRWATKKLDELEGSDLYDAAIETLEEAFASVRSGARLEIGDLENISNRIVEEMARSGNDLMSLVTDPSYVGDDHLLTHSVNSAVLAVRVGQEVGLAEAELPGLCLSALIHESGAAQLPVELLTKKGELSETDWEQLRSRPERAGEIVAELDEACAPLAAAVAQVHERLDGSGYPAGLTGDEICTHAQILAAVDVYEACTHDRPYRDDPMVHKDAMQDLLARASTEFSKEVVRGMIARVGLFPMGSYVRLSTSEIARVLEHRTDNPMRPLVVVVRDVRGKEPAEPRIVDLKMSMQVHISGPAALDGAS